MVLGPIKSPGRIRELGSAEVVRVLPEIEETVILKDVGIAPTHCATLLTRELADWINRAAIVHLI